MCPPDMPGQQVLRCSVCGNAFDTGALPRASPGGVTGRSPRALIITAIVGLALGVGAIGLLALQGSADDASRAGPTGAPAVSAPAQSSASAPDLETGPVTLTWKARLTSSTGSAPAVGSPCTLATTVRSQFPGALAHDPLTLQCEGHSLYDSAVPLAGASGSTFVLGEEPQAGVVGVFRYELQAQDVGARAGPRAQITIDTRKHEISAFRDATPAFRVQATVDELTVERSGRPITAASVPPFGNVVSRKARVTTKSGAVPFGATSCDLLISPGYSSGYTCRVVLTCAGHVAYGEGTEGFDRCSLSGGQPVSFADTHPTPTDGDPELNCDLGAGTCVLGDTSKSGATYSVAFALAVP
jgi:hypothetical protein